MSWPVFLVALWIGLGIDSGLRDALAIGGASPRFVMMLLAFVAASAPKESALWAAVLTGFFLDLLSARVSATGVGVVTAIGPHTLGCVGGAYAVVLLRASIMRRNPLSLPVLSGLIALLAGVVSVSLLAIRGAYDPTLAIAAPQELLNALLSALYTAGVCLPVGPLLLLLSPLFGFHHSGRSRAWRS